MMLESAAKPATYKGPQVEFLVRNLSEGNEESHAYIKEAILKKDSVKVGKLVNEPGIGVLPEEWKKIMGADERKFEIVDCSILIDEILAVKEPEELENIKTASKYACFIMENLNRRFENIIDDDKKVAHSAIANEIKGLTEKPQFQNKFKDKYKMGNDVDLSNLEISSHPIIQSGGNYSLSPLSPNDNKNLSSDVIICKVNSRYKDYNANIIRTFMIDSDKSQQNNYKILYEAFNYLINQMQEGVLISQLYENVYDFIISKDASLKNNLPDNFGNGIGLENLNQSLIINRSNDRKLSAGMSFNIIMSLIDLRTEKGFRYCLQIADTLAYRPNNVKNIFTNDVSKLLSDIYYNMEDEEEEQPNGKKEDSKKVEIDSIRRTRRATNQLDDKTKENQRRKDHQLELLNKKNEDFKERIMNDGNLNEEVQVNKKNLTTIKSYANKSQLPPEIKPGKIFIDVRNDTIILPIFRMMVPFHISLIKNVSKNEENSFSNLRINFHTPITGVPSTAFGDMDLAQPVYIRDLSYKSADHKNMTNLFKQIKDLIKKVKVKDQEEREKSDLVAQESLVLIKGKRIALNDVIIRPNITSKKTSGVLEAHQNGFRFQSNKGEKIDIIYKNIKHAFFQPGENELIVVVHFHLKNPILVGKKKTIDVQFYREAGSQADDLDLRRRGNDYEEYEIELKERMMKEKINDEFSRFTKQVEELKELEFDVPYRDLAFSGVPFKSNVTLIPTAFCLVSLIETPFFVITLDEVELVYFERVSHSIKNFDMAVIYKDLNKPIQRIGTIPMENLEMIKSWLDDCDILFSEGLYNMNWNKVIEKIKKDPESFIEDGGWAFLVDEVIFYYFKIIFHRVIMNLKRRKIQTRCMKNLNMRMKRRKNILKRVSILIPILKVVMMN
jgi:nucleosome binding factor SPN SPT16 subunit